MSSAAGGGMTMGLRAARASAAFKAGRGPALIFAQLR